MMLGCSKSSSIHGFVQDKKKVKMNKGVSNKIG